MIGTRLLRRIRAGTVDESDPRFAVLLGEAMRQRAEGYSMREIFSSTRKNARALGYNDLAGVMVALVIGVYVVVIIIPLIMTAIKGADTTDFPTGTSTLFTTLLPVLVILGSVYLVWRLINKDAQL